MELARTEIEEAHERTQNILSLKRIGGRIIFELGREFKTVKEQYEANTQRAFDLYGYESFAQYHSQPGIAYSVTSVNRFIRLYETYCIKLGIDSGNENLIAVDYTVLDTASRFITPDNADDWLKRLASMGRRDIALTVKNAGEELDCYHTAFDSFELRICTKCQETISKRRIEWA
jgi:hypothetical protein